MGMRLDRQRKGDAGGGEEAGEVGIELHFGDS
jgi:hypothetical protein